MEKLEKICLNFMHQHLSEILQISIDFSCLTPKLLHRLGALITPLEILDISDTRNKLKSKLYVEKIKDLPLVDLQMCIKCSNFFNANITPNDCPLEIPRVDHRGAMIRPHLSDPDFDIDEWVCSLHLITRNWETTFWRFVVILLSNRIWATVNYLECKECSQVFSCIDLYKCLQHQKAAPGEDFCSFCHEQLDSFSPLAIQHGCLHFEHVSNGNSAVEVTLEKIKHLLEGKELLGTKLFLHDSPTKTKTISPVKGYNSRTRRALREHDAERMNLLIKKFAI
jgi:hypothetical protein